MGGKYWTLIDSLAVRIFHINYETRIAMKILPLMISIAFACGMASARTTSDAEIKKQIIQESINNYSGSCPCPYNTDRAGRSCGKRSAYSRAGGYETICYDKDVTPEMIKARRK